MGLLTNPSGISTPRAKYVTILIENKGKICNFLFLCGVIWFGCLADLNLNHATYFSENALLPGLAYSEIKRETVTLAKSWSDELKRERETYKTGVPYPWLLAKMRQIGLETHTQNFTLNYPFGGGKTFTGKNVYGIVRAPRIGSTESIVISSPYRYTDSIHTDISYSIPLMLAFADFARKQKYWAKDIIFLVTDGEQLGMHAWLDAYHGHDKDGVLQTGSLNARAGVIQAAFNLEMQGFDIDYINIKLEGLNGQLPNLDLVNLVQKLANKEGLPCGYKMTSTRRHSAATSWRKNIEMMLSMVFTQASGVPTGNHGLYHRYGIQAVTLEGVKKKLGSASSTSSLMPLLKVVEGMSRSLNNLLEKFHQSFFFYVIVAHDRFVSIGDYMPCIGLMASALMIKAHLHWLELNQEEPKEEKKSKSNQSEKATKKQKPSNVNKFDLITVGLLFIIAHALGFLAIYLPSARPLNDLIFSYGIATEVQLLSEFAAVAVIGMIVMSCMRMKSTYDTEILHIVALLELGTLLIVVGMLNFSLGFLLCLVSVPVAANLRTSTKSGNKWRWLKRVILFLAHPVILSTIVVAILTVLQFPEEHPVELGKRTLVATMNAVAYAVVDSIIYGNWLFTITSLIFFPIWNMLWSVVSNESEAICEQPKTEKEEKSKKE